MLVQFYEYHADQSHSVELDCAETDNKKMNIAFSDRKYEIEFAVKHLAEPTRFFNLMYLWDMTRTTESDGDGLSLR
jgi:hypothetical protein